MQELQTPMRSSTLHAMTLGQMLPSSNARTRSKRCESCASLILVPYTHTIWSETVEEPARASSSVG